MNSTRSLRLLSQPVRVGSRRIPNARARFASSEASSSAPKKSALSLGRTASIIASGAAFYVAGVMYPPTLVSLLFPRPAPPPPHAESSEGLEQTSRVEDELQNLPEVLELRKQEKYYETRPHNHFPEERKVNSMTAGALKGPGKLAVAPILFATWDDKETIAFVHVGRGLCGHDGLVHGGMLATLMDESLARTAVLNFPNKIGVTAKLEVNYKAPTKADQILRLRTTLTEVKGRKAFVQGRVEDLSGNVLVEANALFIEPKYAHLLKTNWTASALGKKPLRTGEKGVPVPQEAAV